MTTSEEKSAKPVDVESETNKQLSYCARLRPYLEEVGWLRSVETKLPVDRYGNYLPWFTYPAIAFLNGRVVPDFHVFEYGSGASTIWWSKRVACVVSFEHDLDWFNSFKTKMPANVGYRYCELVYGGQYGQAILDYKAQFDIIVIDGRDRVNCAKNSLEALKDAGVVIWDNSDRERYQEGYLYLTRKGFKRLDFEGHGPINSYKWCTSIFYRENNCFGI